MLSGVDEAVESCRKMSHPKLQNQSMVALDLCNFSRGLLWLQLKIYIYHHTCEHSPLRRLFVDRKVRIFIIWKELGDDISEFVKHETLEGEFALDFVRKLVGYLDTSLVIRHEESLTEGPKYMNYLVGDKNGKDKPTFQGSTST